MKKENGRAYYPIIRYLILLLIALPNLWLFYVIFTPLTLYPVFILLNIFFNVSLSGTTIMLTDFPIMLVKACIAGSAYYLLLILNLTTPMALKKRICSLIFSFFCFLIINIFRIFFFSILFIASFSLFNLTHLIFWYFLSSIIVFLIWLATIKIYKIKEIPVYEDVKFLYKKIKK